MKEYFNRMIKQLNENKLSEEDAIQLYQDMVDTGYAWADKEFSLHSRMLIEKGIINPPKNYQHRKVQISEIQAVRKLRENKNNFLN